MKLAILASCLLVVSVSAEFCYDNVVSACSATGGDIQGCNAKYSAAHQVVFDVQKYAAKHIQQSFDYLLMSAHFGNYEKNRAGFEKLYRKLSDSTWDDAIDLIKYLGKRGAKMNFDVPKDSAVKEIDTFEMYELGSLSRALDMHKSLAEDAHRIHSEVTKRKTDYHDAEVISFLENQFVHKHSGNIRDLAGHTNDLHNLIKGAEDTSLSVFLFDEYLQKTLS